MTETVITSPVAKALRAVAVIEAVSWLLLIVATLTTVAAAGRAVRAPFLVGAGTVVVVAVSRLVAVLPAPGLVAFGAAGAVLLGVGASYESRRQQAREAIASLADMR